MIEQRWKIGNFCAHMVRPSDHCQITGVKGQEYGQCGVNPYSHVFKLK